MAKEKIYPFAVAKIRVYEKNLLTAQSYIRMAEAKTAEESLRVMGDAGYDVASVENPRDFESVLSDELAKTYALLKELAPEEGFVDVFLYKNDCQNLKALIKAELSGANADESLINGGTIPLDEIKNAIKERKFSKLPKALEEAVKAAYDAYAKTRDGQAIDLILDKAAFACMKEAAKKSGNDFIKGYVDTLTDITNLKTFLRMKRINKGAEDFKKAYVGDGYLTLGAFASAFNSDSPAAAFKATRYGAVADAMGASFTAFEKAADDYIMDYAKSAKYQALTVEPLAAYLYAKESEIKTLRIIMTGKINDIEPEILKERVREAYV